MKRSGFVTNQTMNTIQSEKPAFRPVYWGWGLLVLSLFPLLLMAVGVDFSTACPADLCLTPQTASQLDPRQLTEAIHLTVRGSFTHTLLE